MADENPAMNWLKKTLRENAGQNSDEAAPVQPKEDDASVASGSADYSFKFSSKFQDKFQDMDVEAALSSAVDAAPRPMKTDEPAATPNIPGLDQRFYELTLDRPTGIEFATDLSLKFVYVMEVKDNSPAQLSVTPVEKGDQLCGINGEECIGEAFKDVAELLGKAPNKPLSFRFFRGSKQELLDAVGREDYVATEANVKAIEPNGKETKATFVAGANLRDCLENEGVQVYKVQSGRFTNCNGKQLCGTCIVDVLEGSEYTNDMSIDEQNFLRKMPPSYRLSCCVNVYGDIVVKTRPDTGKKFIEFS
eukprot:CAMPEP_0177731016 /NCGR_PEP_ID=MMETSP0484_2-20121128/22318_1 /TAXON_ID=354590 /ORGANISM="Rhodomonas lens, Strain RHODO" /LENGTH=305 /DNA_ID=CAMNT_0019244085 /DNA_START=209 /DNA_END=1126 /DNA_ORIENTATION=-